MKTIKTVNAPEAIGPYSQAIEINGMLFISGQIPLIAGTGEIIRGGIVDQTRQVMKNLTTVAEAAGYSINDIVKTTCYLKDLNDFKSFNEVYAESFGDHKPARATIQVSKLPKDVLVEIEAIAVKKM